MFSQYVAIDPLALILPEHVYVKVIEKLHPHVPKVAEVQEAMSSLGPQEKRLVLAKSRQLAAYARLVEEAIGKEAG